MEYIDVSGAPKLLELPMTPADFARQETRFAKQFRPLAADANGVPIHEYIDLSPADRAGRMPFVWSTDDDKRLVKLAVSVNIVELVEERRKYWRTLQYLERAADRGAVTPSHHAELAHWQRQYQDSLKQRESSLDSIARAMSELAASSNAPSLQRAGGDVHAGGIRRAGAAGAGRQRRRQRARGAAGQHG